MTLRLSDREVSLLSVPDVMQATDYTCGPSSLLAVLGYYQHFDLR
jgi:predicted double-glycine peptidase